MTTLQQLLEQRILVLDGAMGTMIQRYGLGEKEFRGERFALADVELKGNNDLLCLTAPHIIDEIHRAYLEAGADIIETNTFNANAISMADYQLENYVREINLAAARIARRAADDYSTPEKPRFVAGSVGPTNKSCSMSPDVENPALRSLHFDTLAAAYREQMAALIEGGVDILLVETIFDTLNAKAALFAAQQVEEEYRREIPVMLSVTVTESGRTLSGQTLEAFLTAVSHTPLLSVGLNCSFGARDMKPWLQQLATIAPCYVSAYPNAGLPNQLGEYDETPRSMAVQIKEFIDEGLVNIVGGCCGTTPEHIACYPALVADVPPRKPADKDHRLHICGLDDLVVSRENNFVGDMQNALQHGGNLFFRSTAVAGNGHFYFERGIFGNGNVVRQSRRHSHTLCPAEFEHRLNIFPEERSLDSHLVGQVLFDKGRYPFENTPQPQIVALEFVQLDHPQSQHLGFVFYNAQHAVSHDVCPGVDPDNDSIVFGLHLQIDNFQ